MRVLFILAEYPLHNHVVSDYIAARPQDEVSLIKVPLVLKGKDRLASAQRIVPKLSRRFFGGKLLEFFVLLAITVTPKLMRRGAVFRRLRGIARQHGLPFLKTDDILSPKTLDFIRARRPDIIVTLFHQILRKELIAIPRDGIVNLHPGLIPEFRGIQPYFWELSEGSPEAGATLHLIEDEGIDTGGILRRVAFPVRPGVSVQLNYFLTIRAASRVLPECLRALHAGTMEVAEQDPEAGGYFRWPDSAAFSRLRERGHALFSWRQLWGILSGRYD